MVHNIGVVGRIAAPIFYGFVLVLSKTKITVRPHVLPEVFNGASEAEAGSNSDWLMHSESVATVNEWDKVAKLAWLKGRLTARAQKAFQILPADAQADYGKAKMVLCTCLFYMNIVWI